MNFSFEKFLSAVATETVRVKKAIEQSQHLVLLLHSHVPYHNDTIIKTDTMIKTQEDFFNNTYLSLYCKGSERLCGVLL